MLSAGARAPDFRLPLLSGGTLSLNEIRNDSDRRCAVLLAFLKVSCPTCQYTFPFLERLKDADGLKIVAVSQDDEHDTARFWRSYGLSLPVFIDDESAKYPVSKAYRLTHVPSLFLVEDGTITQAGKGFSRRDLEQLGSRFGKSAFLPGEKTPDFRPG
jgi:peroxiredoxin